METKEIVKRIERCTDCKMNWNISIYQEVDRNGYICPRCRSKLNKEKNKERKLFIKKS